MEPIVTRYNGNVHKSRSEAQWAVFMVALDVRYIYEPQGYTFTDGLKYLPDFWLPRLRVWVEVKGPMEKVSAFEQKKIHALAYGCPFPVCVVYEPPTLDHLTLSGVVYHRDPRWGLRSEGLAASNFGPFAWARRDPVAYRQAATAARSAWFEGEPRLIVPGKRPASRQGGPPVLACRQCGDTTRTTDARLFTTSGLCPPCAVVDQVGRLRCHGCGAQAYSAEDIRDVLEELSDAWSDPQLALYVENALAEREYHAVSPSCSQCSFAAVLCDLSAGGCPPDSVTSPLDNGS